MNALTCKHEWAFEKCPYCLLELQEKLAALRARVAALEGALRDALYWANRYRPRTQHAEWARDRVVGECRALLATEGGD